MKTSTKLGLASALLLAALPAVVRSFGPAPEARASSQSRKELPGSRRAAVASEALARAASSRTAPDEADSASLLKGCDPVGPQHQTGCIPLNPETGAPYTAAQMARFDQIREACRAQGHCGKHNRALPAVLTEEEAARRRGLAERVEELGRRVAERAATPEEIDEYFTHVGQANHHKKQVLAYLAREEALSFGGDGLDSEDGSLLDPDEMSPDLREARDEMEHIDALLYLQRRVELRRRGVVLDGEDVASAQAAQTYEIAQIRALSAER